MANPNRLILVVDDGFIDIDGDGIPDVDMTGVPDGIHAIQWYGTRGEIEFKDPAKPNEIINNLNDYGIVLAKHADAKAERDAPLPAPTPEEIEEKRKQDIRTERNNRARSVVSSSGRTVDMMQALAQVIERKHRKGQAIPARLAAMENDFEVAGDLIIAIDDAAESAIEDGVTTVDQITWPV